VAGASLSIYEGVSIVETGEDEGSGLVATRIEEALREAEPMVVEVLLDRRPGRPSRRRTVRDRPLRTRGQ